MIYRRDKVQSILDEDLGNRIKITAGEAISRYDILALKGTSGAFFVAYKADANDPTLSEQTIMGVASYDAKPGQVQELFVPLKLQTGLDTSLRALGDIVFLNPASPGDYAYAGTIPVGMVVKVDAADGRIVLCPGLIEGVSSGQIYIADAANFWPVDTVQGMADSLRVALGGTNVQIRDYTDNIVVQDNESYFQSIDKLDQALGALLPNRRYKFLDDFDTYQNGFAAADHGWILLKDTNDPIIPAVPLEGGVCELTTAAAGAGDRVQATWAVPVLADREGLVADFRFKVDKSTNVAFYLGLTDKNTLENPVEVAGGTDNLAANAADAIGILFDTGGITQRLRGVALDTGAQDPGLPPDGLFPSAAPINDTWLRITVLVDRGGGSFTIRLRDENDAILEEFVIAGPAGIDPTTPMWFTACVESRAAAARTLSLDWALGQAGRAS